MTTIGRGLSNPAHVRGRGSSKTRNTKFEEQINLKLDEMVKQKKLRPPKPIKTELKSFQRPPTIRQDQTGYSQGASSISEVHLYEQFFFIIFFFVVRKHRKNLWYF